MVNIMVATFLFSGGIFTANPMDVTEETTENKEFGLFYYKVQVFLILIDIYSLYFFKLPLHSILGCK